MADTLDIITSDELDDALNLDAEDGLSLEERAQIITAASRVVDQVYGPVVKRTITAELHDGGGVLIQLRHTPVLSVTTVTEYRSTTGTALTAESNSVKPSSGYMLVSDGHASSLLRRSGGVDYPFASGRGNVAVTYVAGRYDTTALVDERFKEACVLVAMHLAQARGSAAGIDSGDGLPFAAVPFSMSTLRKRLRDMYPDDARPPVVA